MRLNRVLLSITAFAVLSIFLLSFVVLLPASSQAATREAPSLTHNTGSTAQRPYPRAGKAMPPWPEPEVAFARPRLDVSDEIAALKAIQSALNDVGDGSTYVWHRNNGRLSGLIKPTMSFRDGKGQICRHIVVWLTTGSLTKKTETIACRQGDRVWVIEG